MTRMTKMTRMTRMTSRASASMSCSGGLWKEWSNGRKQKYRKNQGRARAPVSVNAVSSSSLAFGVLIEANGCIVDNGISLHRVAFNYAMQRHDLTRNSGTWSEET